MAWSALDPVTEDERCPWVMSYGVPGMMSQWTVEAAMADGENKTILDPVDVLTYEGWQRAVDQYCDSASNTERVRVPAKRVKVRDE